MKTNAKTNTLLEKQLRSSEQREHTDRPRSERSEREEKRKTVHQALFDYARQYRQTDPNFASAIDTLAKKFEGALQDADGVVARDDHFGLVNSVRDTLRLTGADPQREAIHNFLTAVQREIGRAADPESKTFTAYTLRVDPDAMEVAFQAAGEAKKMGTFFGQHYGTYIPVRELEQLFPGRFERVAMEVGKGKILDDQPDDFLFSDRKLRDKRSGKEVRFADVYKEFKRERVLQGKIDATLMGDEVASHSHPTVGLMLGRESVPTESIRLRMPEYLGGGTRELPGTRVVWLVAEALMKRGLIEEHELRSWLANPSDAAIVKEATDAVLEKIDHLEFETHNGFRSSFSGDSWEEGGLRYAIEHGVLALSHDQGNDEVIPDYRQNKRMVITPTGPMMLLYDAAVPALSIEGHDERYPEKFRYPFGVTNFSFGLDQGVKAQAESDPVEAPEEHIPDRTEVKAMRDRFEAFMQRFREDSKAVEEGKLDLLELVEILSPAIEQQEKSLREKDIALMRAFERQSTMRRWFWDTPEVNGLQAEVKKLKTWLRDAKAIRGGARRLLDIASGDGGRISDREWQGRLQKAENAIRRNSHEVWVQGIAGYLHAHADLRIARLAAQLDSATARQDASDFENMTSVIHRWKWLDILTFGESDKGWLFRAAGREDQAFRDQIKAVKEVERAGETRAQNLLHALLSAEDPMHPKGNSYTKNYAEYERFKPAYEQLRDTFRTAREAQHALSSARSAITHRNWVAATQPPMMVTRVSSIGGRTTVSTVINPAYLAWQVRLAAATANAEFWKGRAQSKVNDLNNERPKLQNELQKLGMVDRGGRPIDTDISWWWGAWGAMGFWSFDGSDVADMQQQVGRLVGELRGISDQVTPVYHRYAGRVRDARRARREELEAMPRREAAAEDAA